MQDESREAASASASQALASLPDELPPGTTSWIETDVGAFARNVRALSARLAPQAALAAVVKSDAYGHGVKLLAPVALREGVRMLAVVTLQEGLQARELVGVGPEIIVLGHVPASGFADAARAQLELTIYDPAEIDALADAARRAGRRLRLHVKLETGTHRQGVTPDEALLMARLIADRPDLELRGLSTHFADIEDTTDHRFAMGQLEVFRETVRRLEAESLRPALLHSSCSAATILFPETHLDVARAGIGLYGLWPSRETLVSAKERGFGSFELDPVMAWKCVVAQVKGVPRGAYVGYGRTFRATRPMRIAVLPVGYYEGYARAISGRAHVLVDGQRAAVVGRICMNMFMVDVTDLPAVRSGSVAVLLGRSGDETIRAEDLASWAGTIHYEIVSRIHPSIPRIAVGSAASGR